MLLPRLGHEMDDLSMCIRGLGDYSITAGFLYIYTHIYTYTYLVYIECHPMPVTASSGFPCLENKRTG